MIMNSVLASWQLLRRRSSHLNLSMRCRLGAGLAIAVVALSSYPAAAQIIRPIRTGPAPTDNILTVVGTSEVKATPDSGRVRLGVEVQAATAAEATAQEATIMSNVADAVRKTGVADRDVQTSELNLEPVYENRQNDTPKVTGFRVSNVVQVEVRRTDNIGKVLDAALGAGANRVDSIGFFKQDDSVERAQALRQAAQAAAAKAKTLAAALGITLDGIASVTEGVAQNEPIYARGGMAMSAMAATPISPGQLTLNATVTVQYRLRNE